MRRQNRSVIGQVNQAQFNQALIQVPIGQQSRMTKQSESVLRTVIRSEQFLHFEQIVQH